MLRPGDRETAQRFETELRSFDRECHPLPGIRDQARRRVYIEQLVESIRRLSYVSELDNRDLSPLRTDPNNVLFDPLRAAIVYRRQGQIDEAFWLVFLFVHFGNHHQAGWRYAREVYGRLGGPGRWDWQAVSANPDAFRQWLAAHIGDLKRDDLPHGFGNHRKYQSLDAYSTTGTGAAVESYVRWVAPPRTHRELMDQALARANGDQRKAFDDLYQSMKVVASFGRTARFDYLAMIGNLGLAAIEPGSPYLLGATGPRKGAQLLFGSNESAAKLDDLLVQLGGHLNVRMQAIEDSLCNWQKSPENFVPFRR